MRLDEVDDLFNPGYLALESGGAEQPGGYRSVCALTRMPGCKAEMVGWWFRWLGGTEQYRLRHPSDQMFSDWEGRIPGTHIGSSHLVHEHLAGSDAPLFRLRINFRDRAEFFDAKRYKAHDGAAICANIGLLDAPVNPGKMTDFVRNAPWGCEMRSRFFPGHVASRDPAPAIPETGAAALRPACVTPDLARRLHQHATEETGCLAALLPVLYRHAHLQN